MKAIGTKEVGKVGEKFNTTNSISVVEFDARVLRESRRMEIDFCESVVCEL